MHIQFSSAWCMTRRSSKSKSKKSCFQVITFQFPHFFQRFFTIQQSEWGFFFSLLLFDFKKFLSNFFMLYFISYYKFFSFLFSFHMFSRSWKLFLMTKRFLFGRYDCLQFCSNYIKSCLEKEKFSFRECFIKVAICFLRFL